MPLPINNKERILLTNKDFQSFFSGLAAKVDDKINSSETELKIEQSDLAKMVQVRRTS